MTDEAENKGRVTNNDIDKRVGRLEVVAKEHGDALHQMRNDIAVVKLQGEHNHALISAKFEQVISRQDAQNLSIDRVVQRFEAVMQESMNARSDPQSTPAGRQLMNAIQTNAGSIREIASESKKTREWITRASVVVVMAVGFLTIFGPAIAQYVLGLAK